MNKYTLLIIIFLSVVNFQLFSQTLFTVNETEMEIGTLGGTVGSLDTDGSLDIMISNALISANAGNIVTVELNTNAIILVDSYLDIPLIKVTNPSGKIIIKPALGLTNQGIKANILGASSNIGFRIAECQGDVDIRGLNILNFRIGIHVANPSAGVEYTFVDNTITSTTTGIFISYVYSLETESIEIRNNTIKANKEGVYACFIPYDVTESDQASNYGDLKMINNKISDADIGILLQNVSVDDYPILNIDVTLNNNEIYNCEEGIKSNVVEDDFVITNNYIHNIEKTGMYLWEYSNLTSDFNQISFVESGNTLGLSPENEGNVFEECKYYSMYFKYLESVKVINLRQVEGSIGLAPFSLGNYGHIVRETLPKKPTNYFNNPALDFKPILNYTFGSYPAVQGGVAVEDGLELNLNYTFPVGIYSISAANSPFIIEFYRADDNGSFLEFLGSQVVETSELNSYNKDVTLFPKIGNDQKIGYSATSLSETTSTGTYYVSYSSDIQRTPCDTCSSFKPTSNKRYWLSAWVQEEHPNQVKSYSAANIQLGFLGVTGSSVQFYPSGEIIDGWQRIVGEFVMPSNISEMTVFLNAHPEYDTYFDDIRIHPFNGSMKSYVYDGETFWLTSELDDNNYATFYEYDEEGGLVRIKKETARGIVTIQETRSNTVKQEEE